MNRTWGSNISAQPVKAATEIKELYIEKQKTNLALFPFHEDGTYYLYSQMEYN